MLTIPGPLVSFRASQALTPGMQAIILRIGDSVDAARLAADVSNAVWFEAPAADLRGGRDDNHWLRQQLQRLTGVQLSGEHRGQPWGAVLLAEWQFVNGGSTVRLNVTAAAVNAFRAPETFAKIEEHCLNSLTGAARQLYLALADKKRLRRADWTFELSELRELLGVSGRKAYDRWDHFAARVLRPAVDRINDFGTVTVTMAPERSGRSIGAVRFDWRWKSLDEARESAAEVDRPRFARGKPADGPREAPPLIEEAPLPRPASRAERRAVLERAGAAAFVKR